MAVCDFRSALQSATAPLHVEIDALFGGFDLADRDGLARFLVAQAIGMQACQPHATRFGRDALGCHAPDYYRMLQHDLVILGVDAAQLPCFDLADDTTDAGVFYVVAGSRMGAAVLRNRATAPTPVGIANGVCGYFMPGEGPAMWRRFREWLVGTPDDLAAMIEGAKAAFHLFAQAGQWAADQPVLPPLQGARGLAA